MEEERGQIGRGEEEGERGIFMKEMIHKVSSWLWKTEVLMLQL